MSKPAHRIIPLVQRTMTEMVADELASATNKVSESLARIERLSDEHCRRILGRYAAAIAPNFLPWMAAAAVSCRSLEARYAASENIYVEVKDNHPGLLLDFVKASGAQPDRVDYDDVAPAVARVQTEVSKMSGLFLTAFLGTLEHTSAVFIPWLAALSRRLGNSDMRYAEIHGIADKGHADQFRWALEKEAGNFPSAEKEIRVSIAVGMEFIVHILSSRN